jgi:hypothetical protein
LLQYALVAKNMTTYSDNRIFWRVLHNSQMLRTRSVSTAEYPVQLGYDPGPRHPVSTIKLVSRKLKPVKKV